MLLCQAPFGIVDQAVLLPAVTLTCVWFWSLFRPAAMPPPVVFVIGLLLDLLGYFPLGVGVLTALRCTAWRCAGGGGWRAQGFAVIWLAFVAVAAPAALLGWALTMLLTFRLLPPGPALFQAVLSAALYPPWRCRSPARTAPSPIRSGHERHWSDGRHRGPPPALSFSARLGRLHAPSRPNAPGRRLTCAGKSAAPTCSPAAPCC